MNKIVSFLKQFRRLFETAFVYKKTYTLFVLNTSTWPFYGIVTTLLFSRAVGYLQGNDQHAFFWMVGGYAIFIIVYQVWNLVLSLSLQKYYWLSMQYLLPNYFAKYVRLEGNETDVIGTGKMFAIIDKGVDQQVDLVIQTTWMGFGALINFIFAIYVFSKITRYGPLLAMIFMGLVFYVVILLAYKGQKRRNKRRDTLDDLVRQDVKILMSKNEILMNNKIDDENQKVWSILEKAKTYDLKKHLFEHIGFNVPTISLALITIALFLILGYKFFYNNTITYGEVVLYLGLVNSLESGIRDCITLYKTYIKNYNRVEKLWNTFDTIPMIIGYDEGQKFEYKTGEIALSNIYFDYGSTKVFDKFSVHINGGKKTALVGISGGGKSTLLKLIAGYLYPQQGNVIIDGQVLPNKQNMSDEDYISLKSYYKHVGYLTQEPSVFDGTIYENLVYALDYEPTYEDIDEALQQAQCQFIFDFKEKLQTEIGENGIRLSGGQRQRLAIAKIFLKNPQIVLLDEPTSALDSLSEEAITKALDNLFIGRTVIIIAHRLQTVKKADDIIVINHGQIIERGTHNQLVSENGEYAKMLELQSGF